MRMARRRMDAGANLEAHGGNVRPRVKKPEGARRFNGATS